MKSNYIAVRYYVKKHAKELDENVFRSWLRQNSKELIKNQDIEIQHVGKNLRLWYIKEDFDLSQFKEAVNG